MSISTYAGLKAAISDWLNRDDLDAVVPSFISLAEARLNRDLRHFDMVKRSVADIDSRYSVPPGDWLETVRFHLTDGPVRDLELVSQNDMAQMREQSRDATGVPRFYSITAGQFEFYPTPAQTFTGELVYFSEIPALSDDEPWNWLIRKYPDAYLYGSLVHTSPYLDEDQRASTWAALYQSAVDAINTTSDKARHSGSGLRMMIRSY